MSAPYTLIQRISEWLHWKLNRCSFCHWRTSVWSYMPGAENACDGCVPRGCSCNVEPLDGDHENLDPTNWAEPLDEQGRKWPCCEWGRNDATHEENWKRMTE